MHDKKEYEEIEEGNISDLVYALIATIVALLIWLFHKYVISFTKVPSLHYIDTFFQLPFISFIALIGLLFKPTLNMVCYLIFMIYKIFKKK